MFTAEGVSISQLVPLDRLNLDNIGKNIGLKHAALTPSVLVQTVQFSSRNPDLPSRADAQYGLALALQDEANGFEPSHTPAIRKWHWKAGYEYYSKVFGGPLANPDSHDIFLRLRFPGPIPVEIKPYGGWAGTGHKWYKGVDVGVTFPLSF